MISTDRAPGCWEVVGVLIVPSQKCTRENIATRSIHHILSQNEERSRDMFESNAIHNQSWLHVRCNVAMCLCWELWENNPPQSCTLYCTLYCTLHCTGSNLQCQECSQEPSLGGMNQNISSLWPPLFVNQCSILYLDPEQIDLFSILLMVFIFNAEFGWQPLVLSHKISLILILFLSNPLTPLLKYCVWNLRTRPPTMFVSRREGHYSDGAQ